MRVLVTGADGFIGHHFVEHILVNRPEWHVHAICSFRNGGIAERLTKTPRIAEALGCRQFIPHTADLTCPLSPQLVAELRGVQLIVNFASRSHVDTSLEDPVSFFRDNVDIVLTMLQLAQEIKPRVFVQISTDEVYGPAHGTHLHREWEALAPSNPYSASKAAQEAAAFSWWRAYGVPIVIINTMNNIGERQAPEKFVPMITRKVLAGEPVRVHAVPDGKREWRVGSRHYLHARNHADAILFLSEHFAEAFPFYQFGECEKPPRFHVVGDVEVNNLELAQAVARIVGMPLRFEFFDVHSARPGHDIRYALDGSALAELGWRAPMPFWESLERTVKWTLAHPEWLLVT